jgi:Glyoxalase-like domain
MAEDDLCVTSGDAEVLEQGRRGVPQVVDPDVAELAGGADAVERTDEVARLNRAARLGREDEPVVLPGAAKPGALPVADGSYRWRGELRLWDNEALIGWYRSTDAAVRSKGSLYLALHPHGTHAWGRWVGSRHIYRHLRLPDSEVRVLLQKTDDEKIAKERMHLDLETDDVEAEVKRLEALGAKRWDHQQERGFDFWVMRDPWGNEFCVLQPEFPDLLAKRAPWTDEP